MDLIILFGLVFVGLILIGLVSWYAYVQFRNVARESKNYERGLKMVPLLIHLPPASDDLIASGRDERDVTEEIISQAQVMYNIIASTATKGFKSKVYGQRHISFEIVASEGLVHYYVVVPFILVDVVRQAVSAAYPTARLQEVAEKSIFSEVGKMSGTIGGEFTLKKSYEYPIATYQESKRDASRAILNALSSAQRGDGIAIQIMIRPADEGWTSKSESVASTIRQDKSTTSTSKTGFSGLTAAGDILEALWKPPEDHSKNQTEETVTKQISSIDQSRLDAIEEKIRYPGYESLVRVIVSSNTASQSQVLLKNVVAAFSLFDSTTNNGFKFAMTRNIQELVDAYIFRFFPQDIKGNILNSVELATLFHLPNQNTIPTSQVERQLAKQVDGPTQVMEEGLLLGYNEFRGVKKPIRLSTNDRRRHTYVIGQTGTGKSVLLENLAYQDMMDGRGFAFIDPHGDSVEALLGKVPKERVEDIIYFNPGDMEFPMGLNMFEFDTPDQKDFLIQEAINLLYGLYDPGHTGMIGARFEHIFRNCALLLMSDPAGGTFIDIPRPLIDPDFVKEKLKYVTDQTVMDFWTKEWPAAQKSSDSGEVVSWVVSKFGAFIGNSMMRNIIGQTQSGFNMREIMDGKKILLANLSKGRMGELNSKLLGIIFVTKFQAAAMSRADMAEQDRQDFTLYVDEFQNYATESFETILSEARKYRLSLILGNQFLTQLTDQIREAVIGNVGTVISGRIGITDADILSKKFKPTFDSEDMTKLPNYQTITTVMINNVPSAPFSMSLIPPMGKVNDHLVDALKKLSQAKYGRNRTEVEAEIFERLGRNKKPENSTPKVSIDSKQQLPFSIANTKTGLTVNNNTLSENNSGNSKFLDSWIAKRQKIQAGNTTNIQNSASINSSKPVIEYQNNIPKQSTGVDAQPISSVIKDIKPTSQDNPSAQKINPTTAQKPAKRSDDEVVFRVRR